MTLLLNPNYAGNSKTHPLLPTGGFTSFQEVLRFLNGCKWLVMTCGHPVLYEHTVAFQGLTHLESAMIAKNLAARWQEPTIRTAPASYQVLELVHNLFAALSATASNLPPSCLVPINITSNIQLSSFAVSPKIQDATLTIDLSIALKNWKISCDTVMSELGGATSSLTSLLQAAQPISINHYLFKSTKRRRQDQDTDPSEKERPKKLKKTQAEPNKAVLQPVGSYTIKDLMKLKSEGKIAPPRLAKMKGIQNRNGAALCLPFLCGEFCDSKEHCGFHLQVNEPSSLPGTSKDDYKSFHEWVGAHKSYVRLTEAASSNAKLAP